ncbi:MBL fold metallo-hydrolase [Paenibacillus solani]|uniref:Hydrolase n=1 Tax=Paenibacillus solani TaxID=1705565 RepID=A0A0M1P6W7_9BACL|nr:MBL fold metallo-hydrolase [Paenibacillus solani]KOR90152.1 hydrolase [Paenibacillus solani]
MIIGKGIAMLEISAAMMGKMETIHLTSIWDHQERVLLDAGYPGQLKLIEEHLLSCGFSASDITKIIITHHDLDHIGSLPDVIQNSRHTPEVFASEKEKPCIEGEQRNVKLSPESITLALASLPDSVPPQWKSAFKHILEHLPTARVNSILSDGEELPFGGGIIVIHTPGHTPGHTSLYHIPSKTLIAGDALNVEEGRLVGPNPATTYDLALAQSSLQKLTQYDIQNVICYHGGLFTDNPNQRIRELAYG